MTKTDLAAHLAAAHDMTRTKATLILDDILGQIRDHLAAGHAVNLHGLGTLACHVRAGRAGTGPNGLPYSVPARAGVHFRASAALLAALPAP